MRERGQSAHIEVHITDQELAPSYELGQQIFAAWAEKPPDDIDLAAYAIRHAAGDMLFHMMAAKADGDTVATWCSNRHSWCATRPHHLRPDG